MAPAKGADSTKSTTFGLFWCSLHFGGCRSRKSSKSEGALEMASAKGAGSTKPTTLELLWCSFPSFRRFQKPEIQQIRRCLGNGFRKRSGLYNISNFSAFMGFPSISAVPEAGNPANLKGPWKWFPQKERTLQNRQLLGFCGVPSISAVPEAGNPAYPKGPWKWLPQKELTLQNRQFLGFCGVPSILAVPEAGNHANPKGPSNGFHKRSGVPSISAVPEAGNPANPKGPWKWQPEIQQIRRCLGNGFRKRSGLYNINNFSAFMGFPSISAVPEA